MVRTWAIKICYISYLCLYVKGVAPLCAITSPDNVILNKPPKGKQDIIYPIYLLEIYLERIHNQLLQQLYLLSQK